MTVKLWDIEAGMNINTLTAHDQLIQDIVWDYYGNTYATSCKDKSLRIIDARSPQVAQASVWARRAGARQLLGVRARLWVVSLFWA